jgi:hypothetical protein
LTRLQINENKRNPPRAFRPERHYAPQYAA